MSHKYAVGQLIHASSPLLSNHPSGVYEVVRLVSERDGEFRYRIKSKETGSEREVEETEIRALVLQPGLTLASSALAPVTFSRTLLMAATPHRPVLHRLNRRRPLPHQMPEQPPHFGHGERQQPRGLHDGGFSPRWRAGARR